MAYRRGRRSGSYSRGRSSSRRRSRSPTPRRRYGGRSTRRTSYGRRSAGGSATIRLLIDHAGLGLPTPPNAPSLGAAQRIGVTPAGPTNTKAQF